MSAVPDTARTSLGGLTSRQQPLWAEQLDHTAPWTEARCGCAAAIVSSRAEYEPVAAASISADQVVASTAERITLVTSAGRVMGDRWPALTLEM